MSEIFIHSFQFGENDHLVADAPACLSTEELARAERFKVEAARRQFLISHCLLRTTLSRYLRTDACSIRYRYGKHGKPHLAVPDLHDLTFNLSHSADRLLIAVRHGPEVGVDIELIREINKPLQLAGHFMSGDEAQQLARLTDPALQRELFFSLWTRKEAYIKALGKGFFHALNETDMRELAPGIYLPDFEKNQDCRVFDLQIAADYKAAVAVRMSGDSAAVASGIKVLEQ